MLTKVNAGAQFAVRTRMQLAIQQHNSPRGSPPTTARFSCRCGWAGETFVAGSGGRHPAAVRTARRHHDRCKEASP